MSRSNREEAPEEPVQKLPFLTCDQVERYKRLALGVAGAILVLILGLMVLYGLAKFATADHRVTYCYMTTQTHTSSIPGVSDKQSYNLIGNREWAVDDDLAVRQLDRNKVIALAEELECPLK